MYRTGNLTEAFLDMHYLLHEYYMAWYRKNYGGIDPRHGQGRILTALSRMGAITQKELGFILDMRPQSLGELLQKLETNGYISRRRAPMDKRSLVIELTEKGKQFHDSRPRYEELFSDMSESRRETLKRSFEKISEKLERLIAAENIDNATVADGNATVADENNINNENNTNS